MLEKLKRPVLFLAKFSRFLLRRERQSVSVLLGKRREIEKNFYEKILIYLFHVRFSRLYWGPHSDEQVLVYIWTEQTFLVDARKGYQPRLNFFRCVQRNLSGRSENLFARIWMGFLRAGSFSQMVLQDNSHWMRFPENFAKTSPRPRWKIISVLQSKIFARHCHVFLTCASGIGSFRNFVALQELQPLHKLRDHFQTWDLN